MFPCFIINLSYIWWYVTVGQISVHTCLNNFLYSRHAVSTVNFLLNMLHSLAP